MIEESKPLSAHNINIYPIVPAFITNLIISPTAPSRFPNPI